MNRYVLLQEPKSNEDDYAPQITIVDNTTKIGKGKVERLIKEGYCHIGYLESDLRPQQLKSGFNRREEDRLEKYRDLVIQINNLTGEWF